MNEIVMMQPFQKLAVLFVVTLVIAVSSRAASNDDRARKAWMAGDDRGAVEEIVAGSGRDEILRHREIADFWDQVLAAAPPELDWSPPAIDPDDSISPLCVDFRRFEPLLFRDLNQLLAGGILHHVWSARTAQSEEKYFEVQARVARWHQESESRRILSTRTDDDLDNRKPERWLSFDFPLVSSENVIEGCGTARSFLHELTSVRNEVERRVMAARAKRIEILLSTGQLELRIAEFSRRNRKIQDEWNSASWLTGDTVLLWPKAVSPWMKKRLFESGVTAVFEYFSARMEEAHGIRTRLNDLKSAAEKAAREDLALLDLTATASREPYKDYAPDLFKLAALVDFERLLLHGLLQKSELAISSKQTQLKSEDDPLGILHELIAVEDALRRFREINAAGTNELRAAFEAGYKSELLLILAEIPTRYERAVLRRLTREKNYAAPAAFDEVRRRAKVESITVNKPVEVRKTAPEEKIIIVITSNVQP